MNFNNLIDDKIYMIKFRNGKTRNYTGMDLKRKNPRKVCDMVTIVNQETKWFTANTPTLL